MEEDVVGVTMECGGEHAYFVMQTSDNGYIIAVDSDSAGIEMYSPNNFAFMKIAPDSPAALQGQNITRR